MNLADARSLTKEVQGAPLRSIEPARNPPNPPPNPEPKVPTRASQFREHHPATPSSCGDPAGRGPVPLKPWRTRTCPAEASAKAVMGTKWGHLHSLTVRYRWACQCPTGCPRTSANRTSTRQTRQPAVCRPNKVTGSKCTETLAQALRTKLRRLIGGEPRLGERVEVESLSSLGMRLHRKLVGPAVLTSREVLRKAI